MGHGQAPQTGGCVLKLIGLVVVRNFITYDYCPIEAVKSLMPFCHQVILSDMQSDDGSWEAMNDIFRSYKEVVVERQPWDKPENDPQWWVKALNYARTKFISGDDMLLQLDADEILGPESKEGIDEAMAQPHYGAFFERYNFWGTPWLMAPHNRYCGTMVARLGPARLYLPSDEPTPAHRVNIRDVAQEYPNLHIYHYGAVRDPKKFLAKSLATQNYFFGSCDQRLVDCIGSEVPWYQQRDFFDGEPLREFKGNHPEVIWQWLRERGHKL